MIISNTNQCVRSALIGDTFWLPADKKRKIGNSVTFLVHRNLIRNSSVYCAVRSAHGPVIDITDYYLTDKVNHGSNLTLSTVLNADQIKN